MNLPIRNIEKKLCDIKAPSDIGGFGVSDAPEITVSFAKDNTESEDKPKAVFASDDLLKEEMAAGIRESIDLPEDAAETKKPDAEKPKSIYFKVNKVEVKYKFNFLKFFLYLAVIFIIVASLSFIFFKKGVATKGDIIKNSASAYENIISAQGYLLDLDFKNAGFEFNEAHKKFSIAQKGANSMGASLIGAFSWLPFLSEVNSGNNLINVGVQLSEAGATLSEVVEPLFKMSSSDIFKNSENINDENSFGLALASVASGIKEAKKLLEEAEVSLLEVDPYDFPNDMQESVWELKEKFPDIKKKINVMSEYSGFVMWLLGEDNPKKFLIISQNTAEVRATGGFIGSYGLMSSEFGYIRDIFMDDIYNLDGQLFYKAVPPRPIQKISTAWSMHDANWFLDFPTSAEKIAFFYEKSGGPTPDGVIAINEKVMEEILKVVGSINMPEYGVVVNAENFVDVVQKKVEEDYDKTINRPKKILDDMLPKLFEKFADLSQGELTNLFSVFAGSLEKKDILFWANKPKYQEFVLEKGWGGEVIKSEGADYLAVVSTNINGFKTDRVVSQKISKVSEIGEDGSIINTVKIKRKHNGGNEEYEWLNKVNSNYMRVYVPLGSELLDASGHTIQEYEAPIDYEKAEFKSDKDVLESVNTITIDEKTKTHIFEESQKTVFGNWVHVSPQEEVEVVYTYKLPFKLDKTKKGDDLDFVFQVQPGVESSLNFEVRLPESWGFIYSLPEGSWGEFFGIFNKDKFFSVGIGY